LGVKAFFVRLNGDGTEFRALCDNVGPPNWGYGMRLIRLCLKSLHLANIYNLYGVSCLFISYMLKNKVPWWKKIKKDETRNKKYNKAYPILNHRYPVKS